MRIRAVVLCFSLSVILVPVPMGSAAAGDGGVTPPGSAGPVPTCGGPAMVSGLSTTGPLDPHFNNHMGDWSSNVECDGPPVENCPQD